MISTRRPDGDMLTSSIEPQLRHSMYLNGYVQDMVYGEKGLPDEVFAWMLDERM